MALSIPIDRPVHFVTSTEDGGINLYTWEPTSTPHAQAIAGYIESKAHLMLHGKTRDDLLKLSNFICWLVFGVMEGEEEMLELISSREMPVELSQLKKEDWGKWHQQEWFSGILTEGFVLIYTSWN